MEELSVEDRLVQHGAKQTLVNIVSNHTYAWFGDQMVYEYDEEGHLVNKHPISSSGSMLGFGYGEDLEKLAIRKMYALSGNDLKGARIYDEGVSKERKLSVLKKLCNSGVTLKVYHDPNHYPSVYKNYTCSDIPDKLKYVIVKYHNNGEYFLVVVYEE